jgi:hypothetical protein
MPAVAPAFIARALWLWIGLGVLALAYIVLCPAQFHSVYSDFLAGILAGLAIVACFIRTPKL